MISPRGKLNDSVLTHLKVSQDSQESEKKEDEEKVGNIDQKADVGAGAWKEEGGKKAARESAESADGPRDRKQREEDGDGKNKESKVNLNPHKESFVQSSSDFDDDDDDEAGHIRLLPTSKKDSLKGDSSLNDMNTPTNKSELAIGNANAGQGDSIETKEGKVCLWLIFSGTKMTIIKVLFYYFFNFKLRFCLLFKNNILNLKFF